MKLDSILTLRPVLLAIAAAACLGTFGCAVDADDRTPSNEPAAQDDEELRRSCVCTDQYAPVCATNGKTYSNACRAACDKKKVAHEGECCHEKTAGAMITYKVCDTQTITVWSENAEFIAESKRLLAAGERRIPNFETVSVGADCSDAQYSWHVDSKAMSYADFTIELCDGCPQYIEENRDEWIRDVKRWCPWHAEVTAVSER